MIVTLNSMVTTTFCLFLLCSPFLCSARDTLTRNNPISDHEGETLVSVGGIFELGFFTPHAASDDRRYVGIWYHDLTPRTVVWVANRDRPLRGSPGTFGIDEDGNLRVSNATVNLRSTSLASSPTSRTLKLMDSGNLVLSDDQLGLRLWESFKYPTDTFLPGMKMDENLSLTSWIGDGDPGNGRFSFHLSRGEYRYVISQKAWSYGRERSPSNSYEIDEVPQAVASLLSNFTKSVKPKKSNRYSQIQPTPLSTYSSAKLAMSSTGSLKYQMWDNDNWKLRWSGPGKCSSHNACGNFSSCNNNNRLPCKCLPGFKPSNPKNWDSEDFSGGCTRISMPCGKTDTFLSLKMMKVSKPNLRVLLQNETECKEYCLKNCWCQACSYEVAKNSTEGVDSNTMINFCWIWNEDVSDLQEEYKIKGRNLSVRVAKSDIESTKRDCEPCGTNIIPYPLSTRPDCGDPMYLNFSCNYSTGQVSFKTPSGNYRIDSIDPSTQKFIIQVKCTEYDINSRANLSFDVPFPFKMIKFDRGDFTFDVEDELEISWEAPEEPTCTTSSECKDWPNSTCNVAGDGKKRCYCSRDSQWNGSNLICAKGDFPQGSKDHRNRNTFWILTVMIPLIVGLALACAIIFTYLWRRKMAKKQEHRNRVLRSLDSEKHVKDLIDSVAFQEDEEGIDVPFFYMESILAATDNFSNANKLGQGGYGPVYKGTFPGGKEIAIKRLSSVSGQGLQEFKNEVVLIAKLQHRNLVRLQGYCIKGEEKILLYEYMPNKSLDTFLFDQKLSMLLDWNKRVHIILGIARGLLYLHHDSRLRIIHRDLKTSNILLDNEMNSKISDFGLARMVGGKEIGANTTTVVGTYGYMSPEYAMDGLFSVKSDVFSFGVVLLEIVSGKKNIDFYQSELALSLLGYAWRLWTKNKVLDLVDPALREICNADQFVKFVNVGLLCVQEDPNDRPTMSNVVTMLDSEVATVPTPKQPAFVPRTGISGTASSSSRPDASVNMTSTFEETR